MKDRIIRGRDSSIEFFAGGVRIDASQSIDVRPSGARGDRGTVKGWSTNSRRRMREYLLTHEPIAGQVLHGVTLTVPGPPITQAEAAHLFDHFSKNFLTRNKCGMVWRLEVQKRGAVHWHGILSATNRLPISGQGAQLPAAVALRLWWLQALRVLGPCDWDCETKGGTLIQRGKYRDELQGADVHSVDVQSEGGRGAWLRYLQDHATKAKQEQVAEGFGRHWGVVGRKYFQRSRAEVSHRFTTPKIFHRFLRAYHRLTQPVMSHNLRRERSRKFDGRPFGGRSLGWCSSRGAWGVSVWFSNPATVKRLVEWAEMP